MLRKTKTVFNHIEFQNEVRKTLCLVLLLAGAEEELHGADEGAVLLQAKHGVDVDEGGERVAGALTLEKCIGYTGIVSILVLQPHVQRSGVGQVRSRDELG